MQRHLNIPSLLKYMMSRNLLTNSEMWKLQDSSVPPDERFLQLWQVLQGKGADRGLLVFYLCLMESYGPEPGLTGHYILSQMIRQRGNDNYASNLLVCVCTCMYLVIVYVYIAPVHVGHQALPT